MPPPNRDCDILIIGGGILGSSLAYHLARQGAKDVVVLDLEMSRATFSSTNTNAGGVRATWWQELNILLSRESLEFFGEHADEFAFRRLGYLWLYADQEEFERARDISRLQKRLGVEIHLLGPDELKGDWPHLETGDLAGATWSPDDGLISAYNVWRYYGKQARERGVLFLDHHYVFECRRTGDRVSEVKAIDFSGSPLQYENDRFIKDVLEKHDWREIEGETVAFRPRLVVNAAGAWAPLLGQRMEIARPLSAKRRVITTFASQSPPMEDLLRNAATDRPYGMIVDPSGVYFHPEGRGILAGFSPAEEPVGYDFSPGSEDFFLERIYAPLAQRFRGPGDQTRLKLKTSWSGLYSYSPDISLVMGPVSPLENVFEIHSDTGKGVMHSYAAGRALAERIRQGRYEDERFEIFAWDRFDRLPRSQWLHESLHI